MRKFKIHQETILRGIPISPEQEEDMIDINGKLNELASLGEEQAQYTYGKELFSTVRNNRVSNK